MNLVAKEAPLVNERDGVLILSENAGAHEELGDWALSVNPFDVAGAGGGDPPGARDAGRGAARPDRGDPRLGARARPRRVDRSAACRRSTPSSVRGAMSELSHVSEVGRRPDGGRRRQAALAPPRGRAARRFGWRRRRRAGCASCRRATRSSTAQLAGIMAAKRTARADSALPSACRSRASTCRSSPATRPVEITATVETTAQTGVEMEALTAAAVAALTVYDMAKAIDKGMVVDDVRLVREDEVVKAAVLTVSDGVAAGEREDASGDTLEELLAAEGYDVVRRVVPDEREQIAAAIRELAAEARLVLTTGGTAWRRATSRPRRRSACSTVRRRGSPRRFAPTRSRRRRTRCSPAASPGRSARRSSSTSRARRAAVATASP